MRLSQGGTKKVVELLSPISIMEHANQHGRLFDNLDFCAMLPDNFESLEESIRGIVRARDSAKYSIQVLCRGGGERIAGSSARPSGTSQDSMQIDG